MITTDLKLVLTLWIVCIQVAVWGKRLIAQNVFTEKRNLI